MTPAEARAMIEEKAQLCSSGCDSCERRPYAELRRRNEDGSVTVLESYPAVDGWEECPYSNAVTRKCQACRTARPYAWMKRLDAERVAAWVNENYPVGAFELKELKVLL